MGGGGGGWALVQSGDIIQEVTGLKEHIKIMYTQIMKI